MKAKDFEAGQTAYIYEEKRGKETGSYTITPCIVKTVGRVYVTIDRAMDNQFMAADWFPDGLVKKENYGEGRYLFLSKEAIERYRDKIEIMAWFGENFCDVSMRKKYSLEALRAAKEALLTAGK